MDLVMKPKWLLKSLNQTKASAVENLPNEMLKSPKLFVILYNLKHLYCCSLDLLLLLKRLQVIFLTCSDQQRWLFLCKFIPGLFIYYYKAACVSQKNESCSNY